MTKLAKFATPALAAALALTAAMPAQARHTGPAFENAAHAPRYVKDFRPHPMPGQRFGHFAIRAEIADLQRDIDRAAAMHRISWREARSLHLDARKLERMYWSYARGGLSRKELARLDYRIGKLRMALRHEKRDRNHRRG